MHFAYWRVKRVHLFSHVNQHLFESIPAKCGSSCFSGTKGKAWSRSVDCLVSLCWFVHDFATIFLATNIKHSISSCIEESWILIQKVLVIKFEKLWFVCDYQAMQHWQRWKSKTTLIQQIVKVNLIFFLSFWVQLPSHLVTQLSEDGYPSRA